MKKKDTINGEQLEEINGELFGSFDPDDESWIVGGSKTITAMATNTPNGYDAWYDLDWSDVPEIEGAS